MRKILLLLFLLAPLTLLGQRYVKYFDSIAALVAANPNDVHTVAAVKYASVVDDIDTGGVFFYSPTSVLATNTTTIFKPTSYGGRWIRGNAAAAAAGSGLGDVLFPDFDSDQFSTNSSAPKITIHTNRVLLAGINVKDAPYNAAGNGSTDDTTAIQNALNVAQSSTQPISVYLPVGTYRTTAALTITNSNVKLVGDGLSSIIRVTASGIGNAILVNNASARLFNITIDGIRVEGTNGLAAPPDGIVFKNASELFVNDFYGYKLRNGIQVNACEQTFILNSTFSTITSNGVYSTVNDPSGFSSSSVWVQNCNFYQTTNAAWLLDGASGKSGIHSSWMESTPAGIRLENRTTTDSEVDTLSVSSVLFQNLTGSGFEGGKFISMAPQGSGTNYFIVQSLSVEDCKVTTTGASNAVEFIVGSHTNSAIHNLSIRNSMFVGVSVGAFYSDDTASVHVENNWVQSGLPETTGALVTSRWLVPPLLSIRDTNLVERTLLTRTAANDIQLWTTPTNSALGMFVFDNTKTFYVDVGNDGNDFTVNNGSVTLPSAAAPTTGTFGVAADNNALGAGRGAIQFNDGTGNTYIIGALTSDTPSNGQVPKFNTGGTITWENDSVGGAGSVYVDAASISDPNFDSDTNILFVVRSSTNIVGIVTNVHSSQIIDATIVAADLATDSVSADELNATGVEAELEAVMDLQDMQGAVTDGQVPNNITIDLATLASTVTVIDGTDATSFVAIFDSATGSLPIKTDGALLYDASNGTLTINGSLVASNEVRAYTMTASNSVSVLGSGTATLDLGTAGIRFTDDGDGAWTWLGLGNGNDEDLTWNLDDTANQMVVSSSTGLTNISFTSIGLTSPGFTGALIGNADTATTATNLVVADTTSATAFFIFSEATSGAQPLKTDGGATYDATTGAASFTSVSEGGNAVFNSTEVPGGELGGTWASPTVDDSLSVATWTMTGAPGLTLANGTTSSGVLRIDEDDDAGSNYAEFQVPALAANTVYTLPPDDGDAGEQLTTDGNGVLTWEAPGAGGSGDSITVLNVAATDPDFTNSTTFIWLLDTATAPDQITGYPTNLTAAQLATDSVSADELNATGVEAELESALDIGGEVTSTGMASTVIGDSITVATWTMTGTAGLAVNNGTTGPGAIDFFEDSDNGANRTRVTAASSVSDNTLTLPDATDTLVGKATTDTFTNKTLDAAGTGNVLKFTDYKDFVYPAKADGTGCTILTNDYSSPLWGLATFNGTGETNANWSFYRLGVVPLDLDTTVELVVKNLAVRVSATDADAATLDFGLFSPASSAGHAPTAWSSFSTFIRASVTPSTPAAEDIFYFSDITLTGWAAGVTAGRPFIVGIARLNTTNDDSITIVSGTVEYTRTK